MDGDLSALFQVHRYCGSGDIILVIQEQDSTYLLKSAIIVYL